MKKMWKRFVSLLLACTLLAGMLPLSASAAGEPTDSQWITEKIEEINAGLEQGEQYHRGNYYKLGDSDLYRLTFTRTIDTETATITDAVIFIVPGTDANENNSSIPDYNSLGETPWEESSASAVYIADGVTGIGNHAFDGMSTLETLEIQNPGSLTRIGEHAFNGCDKLVGPLNLSGVTEMGEYAFNGCERLGSGEDNEGVKLSDNLTKIPENAFSSCGLKNVNIPTRCTEIGNNAFANNSLSQIAALVLPEGLTTIGDNAFSLTMGEGDTSSGITSLTIPSTVTSIGVDAFSGRRNLQTVTVKDDKKADTKLNLGDGAFGFNEFTAYSKQGSITDENEITYNGLLGTTFYLPADLVDTFKNGENCFTGDISPMEYVDTIEPTCTTNGYHIYRTTISGAISGEGQPVVVRYHVPLQMLGHDLDGGTPVPASCETGSYTLYKCQRENCSYTESQNIQDDATDHKYTIQSVSNLAMGNGTETVFTWECQQDGHSQERDGKPKDVSIIVNPPAISADTTMTVGDLKMPEVDGGTLTLAASENPDEELTTDVTSVKVVFTPDNVKYAGYTGMGAVSGFGGVELTLKVDVNKAELDFSDVNFGNTRVFVDSTASEGTPITVYRGSLPEDVTYGPPLYSNDTGHNENTPPPRNSTWSGTVSVTFIYDPDKYEVDAEKKPGVDYTFDAGTPGKVTITHSYVIVEQSMDDLAAAPISPLTYKANTPQDTVLLSGVPYSSTVSWTWEEVGNQSNNGQGTETSPSDRNAMDIAPITDAGTYRVTITVEKDGFTSKTLDPITVTIAKATVTTPTAASDLQYTGKVQTGLQDPAPDALYKYVEGSQLTGTNAGPYTATAQLNDSENYRWSTGDDNGDGKVQISWNIAKRRVIETSIGTNYKSVPYIGNAYTAVGEPPRPSGLFTVTYREDGTLVGTLKETHAEAFTITNAQQTNAGTYEVIATITDFDNFYWQNHSEVESYSLGTWTINRQQINAPTITAEGAIYTGEAYAAGKVTLKHSEASDSRGSSQGIIDLENTKPNIRYYTQPTGGNGGDAPVNAGNYYAGVESDGWAFVDGKLPTNYQILGGSRAQFSISKATATMTFSPEEVTATYTAQGTDLQQVTVDGLVDADKDKPASEVYNVTYTYKYRTDDESEWENEEHKIINPDAFVFTDVGQYQITAKWGAGTVSNNYTATDATYTLTIKKAEDQSITLTPDEEGRWTEAINQTPAKYTITYGEAATFKVTGTAALDDADISYEVNGDSEVVSVNGSSGEVTIKQAGEATITVTAADTDNVGAASVEYTVTVNRAEPKLELNEGHAAYTGSEVAEDTYKKATLSGAGEGYAHPDGTKLAYYFYEYNANSQNTVLEDTENENALKTIPSSVGDYWLKVVFPGDACYSDAAAVAKFTITPAELSVSATGHTGTYDGKTHSAITIKSVTGNGTTLAQGQYTVKYAKTNTNIAPGADAGDDVWQDDLTVKDVADSSSDKLYYWYMVTADNYNPAIGKVEVKITPAPLTVTGEPASYEKEYDGDKEVDEALTDITVTAEDVPDVTISVAATGTYADKDAGTKKDVTLTLTLSGTDGTEIDWGNYSYNDQALTEGKITLTKAGAGTITPKAITVTGISAVNRVYDGTTKVQLTGTPETTEGSFIGKDDVSFSAISNQTGTVTDAKAEDGKTVTVAAETLKGLLTGEDAENYTVTQEYPTTVDITPRPVTLQFPNGNSSMTTSYDPNGLTSKPNVYKVSAVAPAEGTGFVSSDALADGDIQYTFKQDNKDVENPINVGEYTVTAELTDEAAKKWSNYTIEAITGTVEIIQATEELTVTVTEKTGLTYTGQGQDPIQSISVKGGNVTLSEDDGDYEVQFKLSEEGDYELDRDQLTAAVKDAKEYTVYWQVTTTNYGNKTDSFTVKVAPATLTLSSSLTKEKKYDGATEAVVTGQKVTGAQNNESITVSSVSAAYDDANVDTDKTITTTYTVTFGADVTPGNYTYTGNVEGKATSTWTIKTTVEDGKITQAPITVAINDQKKVYDGQSLSIENPVQDTHWSTTGTIYLQDGVKDDLGITLSIASGSKDAGTYAITGAASNQNYEVTFTGSWTGEDDKGKAGTYTIEPRPINVQIGNAEGFYGDEPVLNNVALDDVTGDGVSGAGLVVGEVLKDVLKGLELATAANAQSDISNEDTPYTIYAKNGEDPILAPTQLGNYNVTFTNEGTYTVKQRPITITIKDHSSKYGAAIDDGITTPLSGTDYTVAITEGNTVTTDGAIVNGDDLGIALSTTAKKGDNAGTYSISGKVSDGDVSENYSITWAGETSWNGSDQDSTAADSAKGTYTIDKAQLKVSVNRSDIYAQYGEEISNPVTFTNESTGQKIASDASDYTALSQAITYGMEPQGGLTQVEGSQKAEGKFTVAVTQQMVTVTVNVAATENYEAATEITYHIHASASGSLDVSLPFADLTYNGQPQQLLAQAPELPDGVYIRYKVGEKGTWTKYSDEAPNNWQSLVGTGAGDYTVYWETKAGGNYNASSGHETTEIKKADLSATYTGLNDSEVILVLSEMGDTYTIPLDLTGNEGYTHSNGDGVTFLSGNTDVAIAKNSTATLELRGVAGEAKITINCPGDNNYNPGTFTFTVKITDQKAEIKYNITGATTTYNGQPQTIAVKVSEPDSGATVMYWNEKASAYDLSEPPAYTDVQAGGYPIKFQITAPGYKTVTDEATLKIEPKKITETIIAGIAGSYTYTGKEITFDDAISLHDEGVLLKQDTDYTIDYGDNKEVGTGSVIIKGTGNYTGSVTKEFEITPVDASDLTASLNRTFGYYGDSNTNNATVTVTHGGHTVTSDASNTVSVAVTQFNGAAANNEATVSGQTVTFNQVGTYTIEVTVTGNHATNAPIQLTYALLPVEEGELVLEADNETSIVATYGEPVNGDITVTDANGTSMTENIDYSLTYTYTPFEGTAQGSKPYDPSVMSGTPAAGMYVVTATGRGGYANSVGTFTFLILQRDLAEADLTVEDSGLVYNQNAQTPSFTVAVTGNPTADDYEVAYYNNVNASEEAKAVVTATGNNFTGSKTEDFTIAPKPIIDCVVENIPDQHYTGEPVTPPVTITDGNYTLILGYDYTTACDAIGPGTATVTIEGKGNYTETTTKDFVIKSEGAPEPSERFDLVVTPSQWIWKDDLTNLRLSVTFGTGNELTLGKEYTLEVNGQTFDGTTGKTKDDALTYIKGLKPGEYTITATGVDAYKDSEDTETVTVKKIQPELTVTAAPGTLSGGGKVTLTLKGENLPDFAEGQDLSNLLAATAKDAKNNPDLSELEWETDEQTGVMTAELTLPNTNETYTFTLTFIETATHAGATDSEQVVVAQQIISGGGGGGPVEDQPANPDDTGVSDWLNTKDHLAYLAGYPGGTFGPDQNMTRAEAAQMFYNLLLEKDVEITVEFEDVPADAWYAKPVNTLASLGILSGVGNGRFDPDRSITRAEFTVIAMKFANTSGGGVNIFSDVNEDDWFYSAVVDSTQYGWINGYPDGTFRPEATISRAEVTVIVNHMLGRAADRPYVIAHEKELNTFGDVNRGHWGYFHIAEATNAHEYHTEDGTESWTGLS